MFFFAIFTCFLKHTYPKTSGLQKSKGSLIISSGNVLSPFFDHLCHVPGQFGIEPDLFTCFGVDEAKGFGM